MQPKLILLLQILFVSSLGIKNYGEIAKEVNNLKTTWKAKVYDKDYKPLIGTILPKLKGLPEKKFK
jgi:hypothetical protein